MSVETILIGIVALAVIVALFSYLWYISDGDLTRVFTDPEVRQKGIVGAAVSAIIFVSSLIGVSVSLRKGRQNRVDEANDKYNDVKGKEEAERDVLVEREGHIKDDIEKAEEEAKEAKEKAKLAEDDADDHREKADEHRTKAEEALAMANEIAKDRNG